MPRVVPSQVIALIDLMFPQAKRQLDGDPNAFVLDLGHVGAALALLEAVDQIPPELLQLNPGDYNTLLASVATIRASIPLWQSGDRRHIVHFVHGFNINPVSLLRVVLSLCPDEFPSPTTQELMFITDQELCDSIRLDISAANSDLLAGEWKGSTILAGSALEALLFWALQDHEARNAGALAAAVSGLVAANKMARPRNLDPETWELQHYIPVAEHLGLIKGDTPAQAMLARNFRNLIHPGRAARLGQKCDRATALGALAAVEGVARDLTP